jgi:glycosyltransferase involved in cell wall biosynthesis
VTSPKTHRLLVLSPFPPRLDATHGGAQAVARLVQMHAELRRVVLLTLRRPDEPGIDEAVASVCEAVYEVERAPIGRSPRLAWHERQRAAGLLRGWPLWATSVATRAFDERLAAICADWRPHIVQAEFGVMGPYLRRVPPSTPRVLVEHDPGMRRAGGPVARWSWRRFGPISSARADAIVVFTREDLAAVSAVAPPEAVVECIPLPWEIRQAAVVRPAEEAPPTVLFVGSFDHRPNVDAARRLLRLLPEVRRRNPATVLALVGAGAPPDFAGEGVLAPGRVADVDPWLARADVVAVPLDSGGGVRVKVIEALAAGRAVVGSPRAFEGLEVEDGRDAVVADTDEEFVDALVELLSDPGRRARFEASARAWAESLPTPQSVGERYDRLYKRLERR